MRRGKNHLVKIMFVKVSREKWKLSPVSHPSSLAGLFILHFLPWTCASKTSSRLKEQAKSPVYTSPSNRSINLRQIWFKFPYELREAIGIAAKLFLFASENFKKEKRNTLPRPNNLKSPFYKMLLFEKNKNTLAMDALFLYFTTLHPILSFPSSLSNTYSQREKKG